MSRIAGTEVSDDLSEALGVGLRDRVAELCASGLLPLGTDLILSTVDEFRGFSGYGARIAAYRELTSQVDGGTSISSDIQKILDSGFPDVIFNFPDYSMEFLNKIVERSCDEVYYGKSDMVEVVRGRRELQGKTVLEPFFDSFGATNFTEESICSGIAQKFWGSLLRRARPEWLDPAKVYDFVDPEYSFTHKGKVLHIDLGSANSKKPVGEMIARAVFSDSILCDVFNEAVETGVRGIGSVGLCDLRFLLSEEHPELHPLA